MTFSLCLRMLAIVQGDVAMEHHHLCAIYFLDMTDFVPVSNAQRRMHPYNHSQLRILDG